jgi:hypothetical protein
MMFSATLTLTGAAQCLGDLLPALGVERPLLQVWLQPDGANVAPIFVGANADITSGDYGLRLEAAETAIPPAPFSVGEIHAISLYLSQMFVLGTADDVLHVLWVPYGP